MAPLIKIRHGETVQRTRVTRDGSADASGTPALIEHVAFTRPSVSINDDQRGRRAIVERNMCCPRGADVVAGDRIARTNGEVYSVISESHADVDHPLTGHNLGIKKYRVRTAQAPRG